MVLEGNNYDIDTLLIYYQDGQITASELVEHATEEVRGAYLDFIEKKDIPSNNDAAIKFLDWYLDEEQEIEEEDLLDDVEEKPEEDEGYSSWREDAEKMQKLTFSKVAPKVCMWRLKNPMSQEREVCAKELGMSLEEVNEWWQTPNFVEECLGHRLSSMGVDEKWLEDFLFHECVSN